MSKILLVEDNAILAKNVAKFLELDGYEVETAADGARGLEKALSGKFQLAVLDVHLPGSISGLDIVRIVRERKVRLPVLMLTAKTSTHDKVAAFDLGADDYLTKPFELAELAARVKARLRSMPVGDDGAAAQDEGPSKLESNGLVVDRQRKAAFVDGKEVELSALEFRLLEYFVRNAGKTLSRDDLAQDVWERRDGRGLPPQEGRRRPHRDEEGLRLHVRIAAHEGNPI